MIGKTLGILVLVGTSAFASDWREIKSEAMARRSQLRVTATAAGAPKTVNVDCTKGDSVQEAIDKNSGAVVVEIRGVCVENVRIDDRDNITLRGANPASDGLQSASITPAMTINDSATTRLENLSLSNNPGSAVQAFESSVVMTNCVVSGNNAATPGAGAITAIADSFIDGTGLTVSGNHRNGAQISRGAGFFCHGCDFSNNTGFAATVVRTGVMSLLNSTVTGRLGIRTIGPGSYGDIDCITEVSAHPCSMLVTGRALQAFDGSVAYLYGAGDFTGQVDASDRAVAGLYGARQLATGQPGHGPSRNAANSFGHIYANAAFEVPGLESRLMGTDAGYFGRILVTDQTEVAGTIQCGSAGDAWLDPTVIAAPGSAVTGCEHGTLP